MNNQFEVTPTPVLQTAPLQYPRLQDQGTGFNIAKRLQFGPLRIAKEGLIANDGTVDAVKIDGSGLHTFDSTGLEQVKVDNTGFHAYNASAVETLRINNGGIFAYGTTTTVINIRDTAAASTSYGTIGYSSGNNAFGITSGNGKSLYLLNSSSDTGTAIGMLARGSILLSSGNDGVGGSTVAFRSNVGNTYSFWDNPATTYRTLTMSTDKTAIMPTSQGYNALYCAESPEVWFFDFCFGKKVREWPRFWNWHWDIKPDKLFIEVTEAPYRVIPTGQKDIVQVWGKRKGSGDKRFEAKTHKEYEANNNFWSTPQRVAQVNT